MDIYQMKSPNSLPLLLAKFRKWRKEILFMLMVLGVMPVSYGQYFQIKEHIERHHTDSEYAFPVLHHPRHPEVARKINQALQTEVLGQEIPASGKGAFAEIWPPDDSDYQGVTEFSYEVTTNHNRYFALTFTWEGCGAYCETYTSAYLFDSRTGELIKARSLFTPLGYEFVDLAIMFQRIRMIKQEIAAHRENIKQHPQDQDEKERSQEAIDLYTHCLELKSNRDNSWETSYGELYLSDTAVTFVGERCSNHAMRALDELGEMENRLSMPQIEMCLSPQARSLVNLPAATVAGQPKLYRGSLNKTINIHVLLETYPGKDNVAGLYFYDKIGQFIRLTGNKQGNQWTLAEEDDQGKKTGTFILTQAGDTLIGQWINAKTKKELPVQLKVFIPASTSE